MKPGAFSEINTPDRLELQERMLSYTLCNKWFFTYNIKFSLSSFKILENPTLIDYILNICGTNSWVI